MKYETIGGSIHDTDHHLTTIRELKTGDRFKTIHNKKTYEVRSEKCIWSPGGSSVRSCLNLYSNAIEYKRCNTQVIKLPHNTTER